MKLSDGGVAVSGFRTGSDCNTAFVYAYAYSMSSNPFSLKVYFILFFKHLSGHSQGWM